MDTPIRIQFVCLGNICRSPLAEGVFREKVEARGLADAFEIDSSGTGDWHVGSKADGRMRATARKHGLSIEDHRASQFQPADLEAYDHIFVMDKSNLNDVLFLDDNDQYSGKVRLFRELDPEPGNYQVPDPYHGGEEGFERVYNIVDRTAEVLLDRLIEEYDLTPEAA
ncbi:MAG: low molecular weight protein-tyrosine-phosphatase [Longimonas sp.]|uniref:low molecular weight protein-tyrosine-phosphatase n=1 Tax=Longimonas sp. TaxID=2039626 RepID=UPI0039768968